MLPSTLVPLHASVSRAVAFLHESPIDWLCYPMQPFDPWWSSGRRHLCCGLPAARIIEASVAISMFMGRFGDTSLPEGGRLEREVRRVAGDKASGDCFAVLRMRFDTHALEWK